MPTYTIALEFAEKVLLHSQHTGYTQVAIAAHPLCPARQMYDVALKSMKRTL